MPIRVRISLLLAALFAGLATTTPAIGQERRSEVTATYLGLNQPAVVVQGAANGNPAANTFRYKWTERDKWLERAGRNAEVRAAVQAAGAEKDRKRKKIGHAAAQAARPEHQRIVQCGLRRKAPTRDRDCRANRGEAERVRNRQQNRFACARTHRVNSVRNGASLCVESHSVFVKI